MGFSLNQPFEGSLISGNPDTNHMFLWFKQCHQPAMTGNGKHTTYWWWLGDGWWHCFHHMTRFHDPILGSSLNLSIGVPPMTSWTPPHHDTHHQMDGSWYPNVPSSWKPPYYYEDIKVDNPLTKIPIIFHDVSRVSLRFQGTRNHTLRRRGFAVEVNGAATGRSMVAMCQTFGAFWGVDVQLRGLGIPRLYCSSFSML